MIRRGDDLIIGDSIGFEYQVRDYITNELLDNMSSVSRVVFRLYPMQPSNNPSLVLDNALGHDISVTDAPNAKITAYLTKLQTATLKRGTYRHEATMYFTSGEEYTIADFRGDPFAIEVRNRI